MAAGVPGVPLASLTFAAGTADGLLLQARLAAEQDGKQQTKHEKAGLDPARVPGAVAAAVQQCRCRRNCCKHLSHEVTAGIRQAYWMLRPSERAVLMQSLAFQADPGVPGVPGAQGPLSAAVAAGRRWRMAGAVLCFRSLCLLLGTTERSVLKLVRHVPDRRRKEFCGSKRQHMAEAYANRGKVSPSSAVDFFFYEIYMSAAEPLPKCKAQSRRPGLTIDAEISYENGPWLYAGDQLHPEQPTTAEEDAEWRPDQPAAEVLHRLTVASTEVVPGILQRALPHQRLHDLYWVFLAAWEKIWEQANAAPQKALQSPPSYATFHRRWNQVWKKYMRFRKSSEHAQCQTCFDLLQQLHGTGSAGGAAGVRGVPGVPGAPVAGSPGECMRLRAEAARKLKVHYQQQYLDRCIYWSLRWASRSGQMSVLVIIIDSPDKTHFAWPHWPWPRAPKCLDGLIRPRMVVTGVLAHGFLGSLEFSDEQLLHGADAFCEILMLTLVRVRKICEQRGCAFPQHLVVQSDNTVAQCKNALACKFLAYLVSAGFVTTATLNFLMVGHTHEDIDQLFGLMVQWLLRKRSWETPEEIMEYLESKMGPQFHSRGEAFQVRRLGAVRDFKSWLEPLGCHLFNSFGTRGGIEAPHSFAFKMRQDLSLSDRRRGVPGVPGVREDPSDVFCCVKTYMRDQALQQEPVLTIVANRAKCPGKAPLMHAA